ncbi:hypothetical protein [Arenibacter latericius]|nr:hypothetical protein [Arenibacter latericius]
MGSELHLTPINELLSIDSPTIWFVLIAADFADSNDLSLFFLENIHD